MGVQITHTTEGISPVVFYERDTRLTSREFNPPADSCGLDDLGRVEYSAKWKSFVNVVAQQIGYDKEKGSINDLSEYLGVLYLGLKDVSKPVAELPEDQHTEFHHALRVAKIVGHQLGGGNHAILSALGHYLTNEQNSFFRSDDYHDSRPSSNLRIIDYAVSPEMAHTLHQQGLWLDLIESVGSLYGTCEYQAPEVPSNGRSSHIQLIAERALRQLTVLAESDGNDCNAFDSDYQTMYDNLKRLVRNPGNKDFKDTLEMVNYSLISLKQRYHGSFTPSLVYVANLIDELRYPKPVNGGPIIENNYAVAYASSGGQKPEEVSANIVSKITEAEDYLLPWLELHNQNGVRQLKELVYAWKHPHEFAALLQATEWLSESENREYFHNRATEATTQLRYMIENLTLNGHRYVSFDELYARIESQSSRNGGRNMSIENLKSVIDGDEFCVLPTRIKGLGSILKKAIKDADNFDNYLSQQMEVVPERYSEEWFKQVVPIMNDLYASTIVFGNGGSIVSDRVNNYNQSIAIIKRFKDRGYSSFKGVDLEKFFTDSPTGPTGLYNNPDLAIRIKDRTNPGEDQYFNISIGFQFPSELGGGFELQVANMQDMLNALIGSASHYVFKYGEKGNADVQANMRATMKRLADFILRGMRG